MERRGESTLDLVERVVQQDARPDKLLIPKQATVVDVNERFNVLDLTVGDNFELAGEGHLSVDHILGRRTVFLKEPFIVDGETYFLEKPDRDATEGRLFERIFLPYSQTLNWVVPGKIYSTKDQAYFSREFFHPEFPQEDVAAVDDEGNLMPGNITEKIYWATSQCVPLNRLKGVRQLSLLKAPYITPDIVSQNTTNGFPHTRYDHSLLAARIAELILKNNNYPETKVNQGIVTALVHDLATPAFGDPTKTLDSEALDEERNLKKFLEYFDISSLSSYGFDIDEAARAVSGEGTLGQVLDIADKISYTAMDAFYFADISSEVLETPEIDQEHSHASINSTLNRDRDWADVFQTIRITEDGLVYFEDPEKLGTFLELRAKMHKNVYLNPEYRRWEIVYKVTAGNLYSRTPRPGKPLNANNLIFFTDHEVMNIVNRYQRNISATEHPRPYWRTPLSYKITASENISEDEADLEEEGNLVIASEEIGEFNAGSDFLTVDEEGKIKPYSEVRPRHSSYLDTIVQAATQSVIYYFPKELLEKTKDSESTRILKSILEESRARKEGITRNSLY